MLLGLFLCTFALAQQGIPVSGTVTSQDGEALIGVNIVVKGTTIGAVTDLDGNYTIEAPEGNAILTFSYVGFVEVEVPVENRTGINIVMEEETLNLDEIVVVGYGVKKKSNLIGSVSSISSEDIADRPVSGLSQALQGKSAGVNITSNSGAPGEGVTIRIRGVGTVNNADPLYVVDGVIVENINNLSPNDIESVEVLKDAASAAIYGSRGANGVVLVSTKSGQIGRTRVNVDYKYTMDSYAKVIPVLETYDYRIMYELAQGDQSNYDIAKSFVDMGEEQYYSLYPERINWIDEISQNALSHDVNVNVSGGNEDVTYYFGYNYFGQDGLVKTSEFSRNNLNFKTDARLFGDVRFGVKAFYSGSRQSKVPEGNNSIFKDAMDFAPRNKFDPTYGVLTDNPLSRLYTNHNLDQDDLFQFDASLVVPFLENFNFTSKFSYRHNSTKLEEFDEQNPFFDYYYENSFMTQNNTVPDQAIGGTSKQSQSVITHEYYKGSKVLWDNILDYQLRNDLHQLGITAVSSIESFSSTRLTAEAVSEIETVEQAAYPNTAVFKEDIGGGPTTWTAVGFITRVSYNYDERYLLEGSMRADASSNFDKENRWGYFPSAMAGWRISQESFMENMDWINQLKLRASWGNAGNNRIGVQDRYTIMDYGNRYVFGTEAHYALLDGIAPNGIGNPGIRWERTTTYNLGLDLGLFQHIYANLDYYHRYTYDMLLRVPVVASSGMNSASDYPLQNGGDVLNRGGDFELGYRTIKGDFRFDLSANLSFYRNEVLSLGMVDDPVYGGNVGKASMGNITKTEVGGEIGAFYGYLVDGVYDNVSDIVNGPQAEEAGNFPETYLGRLRFVDLNQDGRLDDSDKTIMGSPHPDFTYGLNMNVSYKGFSFNMFWMGVQGIDAFNVMKYDVNFMRTSNGEGTNLRADLIGEIYNPDESGLLSNGNVFVFPTDLYPVVTGQYAEPSIWNNKQNDANFNNRPSSYFIEDASYLRLSDVTLSYNFPKSMIDRLGLSSLRIYVGGKNLLTITNYSGLDPEVGNKSGQAGNSINMGMDYGNFPQSRALFFGVNIGI